MPKVGVNNEPLLERAIFGFDGADYRVVKVDTDGNLVAAVKASQEIEVTQDTPGDLKATVDIAAAQEIEVTQPTAADLKATVTIPTGQDIEAQQFGWISSAWQKNPLALGYSSPLIKQYVNDAPTGSNPNIDTDTVPSGELWVITNITERATFSSAAGIRCMFHDNSNACVLYVIDSPTSLINYDRQGYWVLPAGAYLRMTLQTAVGDSQLVIWITGFIVETDQ